MRKGVITRTRFMSRDHTIYNETVVPYIFLTFTSVFYLKYENKGKYLLNLRCVNSVVVVKIPSSGQGLTMVPRFGFVTYLVDVKASISCYLQDFEFLEYYILYRLRHVDTISWQKNLLCRNLTQSFGSFTTTLNANVSSSDKFLERIFRFFDPSLGTIRWLIEHLNSHLLICKDSDQKE